MLKYQLFGCAAVALFAIVAMPISTPTPTPVFVSLVSGLRLGHGLGLGRSDSFLAAVHQRRADSGSHGRELGSHGQELGQAQGAGASSSSSGGGED